MKGLMAEYLRKVLNEDDQSNPELSYVDEEGRQRKARAETLRKYDPSHPGRQAYERWKQTSQAAPTDDTPQQVQQATPEEPSADTAELPKELEDTPLQYSDGGVVKQATAAELSQAPEGSGARKRYERFVQGATFQQDNTEFQQHLADTLQRVREQYGRGQSFTFTDYKDENRSREATDKKIAQDGVAHQGYYEYVKDLYDKWSSKDDAPTEPSEPVEEPTVTEEPPAEKKSRREIVSADGKVTIGTKKAKDPKSQAHKLLQAINAGDEKAIRDVIKRMRLSVSKSGKLFSHATQDKVFGGESDAEKLYTHAVVTLLRDKYSVDIHGSENLVNPDDTRTPGTRVRPSHVYKEATSVDMKITDGGRAIEVDGVKMSVVKVPNNRQLMVEKKLFELKRRNPDLSDEEAHARANQIVATVETYNTRIRFLQSELRDGAQFVSVGQGREAAQTIGMRLKEAISESELLTGEQIRIFSEQINSLSEAESVEELGERWASVRKTLLTIPFMRESKVFPYFCEHVEGMRAALKGRKVIFPARGDFKLGDVTSLSGAPIADIRDMRQIVDSVHILDVVVDITGVKDREGAPSTMGTRIETGRFTEPMVTDSLRTLCGNKRGETESAVKLLFSAETPEELESVRLSIHDTAQTHIADIRSYYRIPDEINDADIISGLSQGSPPKYNENGEFIGFGERNKRFSRAADSTNEQQLELYSLSGYAFDAIYASNIMTQAVGLVSFGVDEIVEADGMSRLDRSEFNFDFALRVTPDRGVVADSYRSRVVAADVRGIRQINPRQEVQQEIILETKMRSKKLLLEFINRIVGEGKKSKAAEDAERMGLVKKPGVGLYGPPGDENPATYRSSGGELVPLGADGQGVRQPQQQPTPSVRPTQGKQAASPSSEESDPRWRANTAMGNLFTASPQVIRRGDRDISVRQIIDPATGTPIDASTPEGRTRAVQVLDSHIQQLNPQVKEAAAFLSKKRKDKSKASQVNKWLGNVGELAALRELLAADTETYLLPDSAVKNDILVIRNDKERGLSLVEISVKSSTGKKVGSRGANARAQLHSSVEGKQVTRNGKTYNATDAVDAEMVAYSQFMRFLSEKHIRADGVQNTEDDNIFDQEVIERIKSGELGPQSGFMQARKITSDDIKAFRESPLYIKLMSSSKNSDEVKELINQTLDRLESKADETDDMRMSAIGDVLTDGLVDIFDETGSNVSFESDLVAVSFSEDAGVGDVRITPSGCMRQRARERYGDLDNMDKREQFSVLGGFRLGTRGLGGKKTAAGGYLGAIINFAPPVDLIKDEDRFDGARFADYIDSGSDDCGKGSVSEQTRSTTCGN
jgi:hypothetical protein